MNAPVVQTDTPSGFVCAMPWATVDRALVVDVKAYLASVRSNRNVLSTRFAARSKSNIAIDETFVLPASVGAPAWRDFMAPADNVLCVVSANRPVHMILTRETGEIDLGLQTLFVTSSPIAKIRFANTENLGNAEINLILV